MTRDRARGIRPGDDEVLRLTAATGRRAASARGVASRPASMPGQPRGRSVPPPCRVTAASRQPDASRSIAGHGAPLAAASSSKCQDSLM